MYKTFYAKGLNYEKNKKKTWWRHEKEHFLRLKNEIRQANEDQKP